RNLSVSQMRPARRGRAVLAMSRKNLPDGDLDYWKAIYKAGLTTFAPILISLSFKLVGGQIFESSSHSIRRWRQAVDFTAYRVLTTARASATYFLEVCFRSSRGRPLMPRASKRGPPNNGNSP